MTSPASSFTLLPAESLSDRAHRFWHELLDAGAMGHKERADDYADFINCGMKPAGFVGKTPVDSIASWSTSCAEAQRAALHWMGLWGATKPAINGQGIFDYIGVAMGSPAWQAHDGVARPEVGDILYWANTGTDGHVEMVIEYLDGDVWATAGGGGGTDGTECSLRTHLHGADRYGRKLVGWLRIRLIPGIPLSNDAATGETTGDPEVPPTLPTGAGNRGDLTPVDE